MKILRCCFISALASVCAWGEDASTDEFTTLTLEELSQIQVTSIARKHGSLFDTAGAAFVLTGEDIQRIGATNLATALRPVPGMQVGQINSFDFAISTRGFNDHTSSKLLVLMDGRSLYSQTFSGAYWNFHELFVGDLDRLETVRGPGAALWGANAVNGVINIVSKSAFSTVGTLLTATAGDRLDGIFSLRHGVQLGDAAAVRVYARYNEDGDFSAPTRNGVNGSITRLLGSRFDWKRRGGGALTLIGEFRDQTVATRTRLPQALPPYEERIDENRGRQGGFLLARWRQPVLGTGEITTQASYERTQASDVTLGEKHRIFETDVQVSLRPWPRHHLLGGANLRRDEDVLRSTNILAYGTPAADTTFVGAFLQDEISLLPRFLTATAGAKFERNSLTGWELQPNLRFLWAPSRDQRVWAAVSRAVRTPTRTERNVRWLVDVLPPAPPLVPLPVELVAAGSQQFDSERVTAYELGHRLRFGPQLTIDTALFVNAYRDVRGLREASLLPVMRPVPRLVNTYEAVNNVAGQTYGGEVLARWRPTDALQFEGSASLLRYDLEPQGPGLEVSVPALVGMTPRYEYKLRANWDFSEGWTFDVFARHFTAMPVNRIPAHTGVDFHLGWRPHHLMQIELVVRNAFDPWHPEAPPNFLAGSAREIPRSYFVRLTLRR